MKSQKFEIYVRKHVKFAQIKIINKQEKKVEKSGRKCKGCKKSRREKIEFRILYLCRRCEEIIENERIKAKESKLQI